MWMVELILKARFEEAKGRELTAEQRPGRGHQSREMSSQGTRGRSSLSQEQPAMRPRSRGQSTGWSPCPESTAPSGATTTLAKTATASIPAGRSGRGKCFNCGLEGHLARNCPYPKKGRQDEEARVQKRGTVSALTEEEEDP